MPFMFLNLTTETNFTDVTKIPPFLRLGPTSLKTAVSQKVSDASLETLFS